MEDWEEKIIVENMRKLVKATICNMALLLALQESGIISEQEIEDLLGMERNRVHQAYRLYCILRTRVNAFDALLQGLWETNQTGAFAILTTAQEQNNRAFDPFPIRYDMNSDLGKGSCGTVVYKGKFGERDVAIKNVQFQKESTVIILTRTAQTFYTQQEVIDSGTYKTKKSWVQALASVFNWKVKVKRLFWRRDNDVFTQQKKLNKLLKRLEKLNLKESRNERVDVG